MVRYHRIQRLLAMASIGVFASVLATVGPAHAYNPDPNVRYLKQDAHTCSQDYEYPAGGSLTPLDGQRCGIARSNGAVQYYDKDPGLSQNLLMEFVAGGQVVGFVSFQAYGEHLKVVDLKNDGDSFYVWVDGYGGPYGAPGTSAEYDQANYNLSLPEDYQLLFRVTDDKAGNDWITGAYIRP